MAELVPQQPELSSQESWHTVPIPQQDGEPSQAADARREILPGYVLIEQLGAGGYGTVWRAEAPGGLAKAIKIIHGQFDEKRAADEWKSLQHVKVIRHPFMLSLERIEVVDQQLIIVTELADGSLKDRFDGCVQSGRPGIPRNELLSYLAEAADALDYMSVENGLQHLDVKPENLLLVGSHIKVADFGLVKNVHGSSVSVMAGLTPMFSAPENFDGRPTDRSDQYSLAVVYQYLLTGRCPFSGQSFAQLASQHLHGRPDLQSLPEPDRAVIERALAKDPFDRYPSCSALIARLQEGSRSIVSIPASEQIPQSRSSAPLGSNKENRETHKTEVLDVDVVPGSTTLLNAIEGKSAENQTATVDLPPVVMDENIQVQPTLFVGVGGCGIKVVRMLQQKLQNRLGSLEEVRCWRVLGIDTDQDEFCSMVPSENATDLEASQFLCVPLESAQYYRQQSDELTHWLSRRWIYNIPKSLKTEGLRPLGRLALVDHIQRIDERLRREISEIRNPSAIAASTAKLQHPIDQARPRVFIVGSISRGTASGMVWDLVQMVRQILPQQDGIKPEIICVLAHWTSMSAKEVEVATANACAAVRELHHYISEGCPGDSAIHLPALGRHHGLFNNVYMVDLGSHENPASLEASLEQIADYIDLNVYTRAAAFMNACRESQSAPRSEIGVRSFSVIKIQDSDLAALEDIARKAFEKSLRETPGDASVPQERRLAIARRRAIEEFIEGQVSALQSTPLACASARRFLVATSSELREAGFVTLVQQYLPANAASVLQDENGITLLCEYEGLSPSKIAWAIVKNRPELMDVGSRLVTRSDVAWAPL